ncbi:MAG: hypothetical protein AB7H90_02925 [Alphaproteobacteria bacterium]
MPTVIQTNFTAGEVSPLLLGRADLARWQNACARLRNMIVLPQGGATRRTGTRLVAKAKYQDRRHRLVRFLFGDNQAFVLEFGDLYIRFFTNDGQVLDGLDPYEIATPWSESQLAGLTFTQSADILYVMHPNVPTRELRRIANTNWQLAVFANEDGPYLPVPKTPRASLTPSAATATATLIFDGTAGINGGAGFAASDVSRQIRVRQRTWRLSAVSAVANGGSAYQLSEQVTLAGGTPVIDPDGITETPAKVSITEHNTGVASRVAIIDYGAYLAPPSSPVAQAETTGSGSGLQLTASFAQDGKVRWSWGTITAVNSTTSIDVAMNEAFISTDPIDTWRLGAWSGGTQYPTAAAFFQQRLYFGGADGTAWGSEIGDYPSFSPTEENGQVIDSNAVTFSLDDTEVNTVVWLSPAGAAQIPQLGIGTAAAEHVLSSSDGGAVTPTTPQAYPETRYGAKPGTKALRIGKAVLFVGKDGTQLYEWTYQFQAGGYIGEPIEILSEHLILPGIVQPDYAQQPYSIVWAVTEDGGLAGMTYRREQEIRGWHAHRLGGSYYAGPPVVESHAVIPAPDRSHDQLWLSVLRRVNGAALRTIETMTRPFRDTPLEDAVFVDGAISSALTKPATVCALGFVPPENDPGRVLPEPGDTVVVNFTAATATANDAELGTWLRINGGLFRVTLYLNPVVVTALCYRAPDSLVPALSGEWSYTAPQDEFSGLDIWEGEEVAILGDGAVYPRQRVTGGRIVLPYPASHVTVGLPYDSELETLPLEIPAQDGTSQGRTARLDHLYLRLFETVGGEYGGQGRITDRLRPRSTADPLGAPPPLFTGDERLVFPGGHDAEHRVHIRQSDPLPMTVLAIVAKGRAYERSA